MEAGHRVSYASLRALAATFEMDADLLERELYAMNNKSTDDFVEAPRWVRLLNGEGLPTWQPFAAAESVLNFADSTRMEEVPHRAEFANACAAHRRRAQD